MRRRPLTGIRVLALEQAVAAPLCTRHLADLGAEVIKVEHPEHGDLARHYDSAVLGDSAYFVWLNRGKRSVALDVREPYGRDALEALLSNADIFVHNLGPGSVARLGFATTRLRRRWPRLIICAISGYGSTGPYRGRKAFDLLLQGETGITTVTGSAEQPAKVGVSIADISAGMYSLASILAALHQRSATGEGSHIDISMLESLAEWVMAPAYHAWYQGAPPARTGLRHNMIAPYGPFTVRNGGAVNIAVQTESQWRRLCEKVLGAPHLADDPRFATNVLRVENYDSLAPIIEIAFAGMTRQEALTLLDGADIPFGNMNDLQDVRNHPQLRARRRWLRVHSGSKTIVALADPMNIAGVAKARGSVPALGQDTDAILSEIGFPSRHAGSMA